MLKQLLTGASVLTLLLAGSANLSAQAQTPPQQGPGATPSTPRRSSTPAAPGQSQGTPHTQISQEDLQKFAQALQQVHSIQQEGRSQALQVLQQVGLTQERFNQIAQAQQQGAAPSASATPSTNASPQAGATRPSGPAATLSPDITPAERQHFQQAVSQLNQIRQDSQNRMQQAVSGQGLNVQQFNQILTAVRQDPQLQQQVVNLMPH